MRRRINIKHLALLRRGCVRDVPPDRLSLPVRLDPDVPIFDHVDFGLQGEGSLVGDFESGFEQLAVAGATGLGAGDDHLDRVPVAVLVPLERLVRTDSGIVSDLELVREGFVSQVKTAVRVSGRAEFQAKREVAVIRLHRVDRGHLGGRVL